MNKWINAAGQVCIVCVFSIVGSAFSQDDFLIENQRTNLIENATWGDTYVGKYTDENNLVISNGAQLGSADAFVGFSDMASSNTVLITGADSEWSVGDLQIGSDLNDGNQITANSNGTINVGGALTILGVPNGNSFILDDGGSLKMGSDFDAGMAGFIFNSNGTLSVAGTLSNMDEVEGSRHLILSGGNADWLRSSNTVHIGANSDRNSLTIDDGAQLDFTHLVIGAAGTTSNLFNLASGSQATIVSNLTLVGITNSAVINGTASIGGDFSIDGQNNTTEIGGDFTLVGNLSITGTSNLFTVGGTAKILGDIDSNTGIQFSGGTLEASHNVDMESIDGNGTMTLTGNQARWTTNANISVGAKEGGTTLLAQDNALIKTDRLEIGSTNVTGNSVALENGGKLILTGTGSYIHNDNSLTIGDGGWLTLETDASSAIHWETNASFYWDSGGTVEYQGAAHIFPGWEVSGDDNYTVEGTLFLNGGRRMIINGSNAYWAASAHNLHVGDLSSDNTLVISNGAWAAVKSMSIGDFTEMGGSDNLVLISGAGTSVTSLNHTAIGGTLLDGVWHEGGAGNILRVEDGAAFYSPGTLHNRNATGTSGLEIASGAVVDVDNYYQGSGAYLTLFTDASGTNVGRLVADTAEFEKGARVGVDAVAKLQLDLTYTNTIVEANTMIIGGSTNGTSADLAMLDTSGGSLINYNLLLDGGSDIVAIYSRNYISYSAGFDPDSILSGIADEIDFLASQGNTAASNQVNILNGMTGAQQSQQMEQLYVYGLPTFMHNQGVFGGIDQVRARGGSGTLAPRKPRGAAGPHAADQGMQGWVKVYGGFGSRAEDGSGSGFNDGYDAQAYGTVLGVDRAFDSWLFGIAGGYAGSNLEGDNGDSSDASTGYGILYANYGTEDWFGDLVLGHGLTKMDNRSGTDFRVTSDTDASQTAFYIGGGKEAVDEDTGSLVRALVGFQVSNFDQDAYTENSADAVVRDVDAYDRMSYQSKLGISMSYPTIKEKFDLESQFRAFWLHEFNGDEEIIGYTLVDSNLPGQFIMRSPDQDVGQFGFGFLAKWDSGLQFRLDLDGQVSKSFYSATFSGALLYEF